MTSSVAKEGAEMKTIGKQTAGARTGRVKYPGIVRHARHLGVSYPHLWQVLTGRRQSRRLMQGYVDLMRRERSA